MEKKQTWNRMELAMFIAVLMLVALGVVQCDSTTRQSYEKRAADEARYIEKYDCAVSQMRGKYVASYRCTKPELRHMSADALANAAANTADAP